MSRALDPLDEHRRELRQELPEFGSGLERLLSRAEFPVQRIERGKGSHAKAPWFLYVKPAEHVRASFELAPELLVLLLPASEAFAQDLQQAEVRLNEDFRLDAGLVLAIVQDATAARRLAAPVSRTGRSYVFIEFRALADAADPLRWLRAKLREQLGAADLFAPGPPVTGWDFFGRDRDLRDLRKLLIAGKPVGLYGLRKVGKTSLALRCLEQLARHDHTIGVHIDLQALTPIDRNFPGFMRRLLMALGTALQKQALDLHTIGLNPGTFNPEILRRLADPEVSRVGVAAVDTLIDWATHMQPRRVVLFIDEYERWFDTTIFDVGEATDILDYLRGLVQTHPSVFNFIIAGLTRRFAAQPRIGNRQNALFGFAADFPIAGLGRPALQQMFRKIGKRVGLAFAPAALDLIHDQTGGHPALARTFGRLIHRRVPAAGRDDTPTVSHATVADALDGFKIDGEVETTMHEIYLACRDVNEHAPTALARLAIDPYALKSLPAQDAEQLRRLGIVDHGDHGWTTKIGCFANWLSINFNESLAVGT